MLMILFSILIAEAALAADLNSSDRCVARNPADVLCLTQGGCPLKGFCHFPDGSYYLTWSIYNRICNNCDIWALSDEGMRNLEARRFLDSSDCYQVYSNQVSLDNGTITDQAQEDTYNTTDCTSCR